MQGTHAVLMGEFIAGFNMLTTNIENPLDFFWICKGGAGRPFKTSPNKYKYWRG